jgi:hypothetical protein
MRLSLATPPLSDQEAVFTVNLLLRLSYAGGRQRSRALYFLPAAMAIEWRLGMGQTPATPPSGAANIAPLPCAVFTEDSAH